MKNTDPLNTLDKIQKVEAPEFLLTRIYAKIENLNEVKIKPSLSWTLIGTLSLVIFINAFILVKSSNTNKSSDIVTEMGIEVNNSIY